MTITRKHFFSFLTLAFVAFVYLFGFSVLNPAFAAPSLLDSQAGMAELGQVYGAEKNPTDVRIIIVQIIQIVLGFLAIIFLSLIVFAGFRYMTAAGNEDQTKKAVSQITSAVIGLLIILAAWVITSASLRYLSRAVSNNLQIFEK